MIRTTIRRSLATSKIHSCALVMKDGHPDVEALPILTVAGKVTEKEALKALKKVHGKNAALTVTEIETSEDVYEISVEDFMKYATKVDSETAESDNE